MWTKANGYSTFIINNLFTTAYAFDFFTKSHLWCKVTLNITITIRTFSNEGHGCNIKVPYFQTGPDIDQDLKGDKGPGFGDIKLTDVRRSLC